MRFGVLFSGGLIFGGAYYRDYYDMSAILSNTLKSENSHLYYCAFQ